MANDMPIHHIFYTLVFLHVAQVTNVQQAASGNVSDTLVETCANRAKVEAINFLDDRSKVLQTLSSYSNVCSKFLKYNTTFPLQHHLSASSALED